MGSIQTLALVWGAPRAVPAGARGQEQDVCEAGRAREGPWLPGEMLALQLPRYCPPEELLCLSPALTAVPCCIPGAHSSSLTAPRGTAGHPERAQAARARGLTLRAQRFLALSETGETLPLDTPIPPQAHRGSRSRNTAGAAGAVQTSGISQEERGRKEWEVHGCCSPREHIILLLMQRSKAWTGPELLSS